MARNINVELIGRTGILTRSDIESAYISATSEEAVQRKFDGWLRGYRHLGNRTEKLNRPLQHFRDGRTVLVKIEWLLEFITANAGLLDDGDSTGEGASES